ncbi:ATP-binding protein [Sinomonas sp. R1AF57]|uniref:ATP-binding protein n=1 Tax=Sinomonas sp. R1AF57 TaxID=2020377 RepID=UPI000B5DD1F0|nr:ATP-binding protein [Sinomonas sp. R1AF57]ASN53174.1 ATP-binding protein [Sinomonas sp. R1AF57]
MSIAAMLPLGTEVNPGQYRLALVQVVNWGTFHGAHTMHVDRGGTMLTGNSGVGKSTLFDAIARVFDARPRSNEAAAARTGHSEDRRTTYTYMRGKVGDVAVGEGQTSAFQRPGATWSAVALTFDNAAGTRHTLTALFDLPKNGTESSLGRFYLIDSAPLDVQAVEGLAGEGQGRRFTKSALEALFPDAQVFDVHKTFAERFRRLLGISSDQALPLLRVIQAGKGLGGSVNSFFRDQVLDPPATLAAADEVVEEFSNLMSIRARLEDVRLQRDQLAPVPALNSEHAAALEEAAGLRELAAEPFDAVRQAHAVTVQERLLAGIKASAQAKAAELAAERQRRDALAADLRSLEAEYNNAGGNQIATLEQARDNAAVGLRLRREVEEAARAGMRDAGLDLPFSAEGWAAAHQQAAEALDALEGDSAALKEARFEAFEAQATAKRALAEARAELAAMSSSKSLLPPSAVENRARIAQALGLAEEEMPFGGELVDLADGEERWRPAAERALRSLATTLLVPGRHFAAVTRWLDANPVRGALRAVDLSARVPGAELALAQVRDGDLLTKLQFRDAAASSASPASPASSGTPADPADDPAQYVRERIAADFAFPCVENPDELAGLERGLSLGGVVKRGRGTVEKDDRFAARADFVLGFDNGAKVELLASRVLELESALARAAEAAQASEDSHQGVARRIEALRRVAQDDRPWEELSSAVAEDELARIEDRLRDALAAQSDLEPLRAKVEAARAEHQASTEAAAVLGSEYCQLDSQLSSADRVLDAARSRLAAAPPSDAATGMLAPLFAEFGEPGDQHDLERIAAEVQAQLAARIHAAESRAQAAAERLTRIFEQFQRDWGSVVSADHGTSVAAADAFEDRYHQIVTEGLPAQESQFREFFAQRTHESFSTLLHLLDEERRGIAARILPLNSILAGVDFHEGSYLELDIRQTVPASAKQFKDAIVSALKARHAPSAVSAASVPASAPGTHDGAGSPGEDQLTIRYKTLEGLVKRLASQTPEDRRWRAEVLDTRAHVFISCKEHRVSRDAATGEPRDEVFVHADTGSMSGGERQRFTAFIMAAALSYQLGIAEQGFTSYGTVMMDEAFVLASEEFAGAGISALHEFGFQLLLAAPENVIDLSRYLGSVTEILRDKRTNRSGLIEGPAVPGGPASQANPVDIVLR